MAIHVWHSWRTFVHILDDFFTISAPNFQVTPVSLMFEAWIRLFDDGLLDSRSYWTHNVPGFFSGILLEIPPWIPFRYFFMDFFRNFSINFFKNSNLSKRKLQEIQQQFFRKTFRVSLRKPSLDSWNSKSDVFFKSIVQNSYIIFSRDLLKKTLF